LEEHADIKGLAEQEYGPQHPITKKLSGLHADAQALMQGSYENVIMPQYMSTASIARMRIIPKNRILLVILLITQTISRTSLPSSSGVIFAATRHDYRDNSLLLLKRIFGSEMGLKPAC
jgi:hypothetical protein